MSFLFPWAWWLLGLVPLIAALYLRRVKPRILEVPALFLWKQYPASGAARRVHHRLRDVISLILILLLLILLMLALAGPVTGKPRNTVIILDTGFAMQTVESSGKSRFEMAEETARALLTRASEREPVAVMTSGGGVAIPFVRTPPGRKHFFEKPTSDKFSLEDAVKMAEKILPAPNANDRILILTGPVSEADQQVLQSATEVQTQIISHGTPHPNVAIQKLAARPHVLSPLSWDIMIEIANHAAEAFESSLEVHLAGEMFDAKRLSLEPGEIRRIFQTIEAPSSKQHIDLEARLNSDDPLREDNSANIKIPPAILHRALLVTAGNRYLEAALGADSSIQFELLSPENFQPSMAAGFDAVILDNVLPAGVDEKTPGNFLFFGRSPWTGGDRLPFPGELKTVPHPALPPHLNELQIQFFTPVTADENFRWQEILSGPTGPLILAGERDDTRCLATAFAITDSDMPLRVALPMMISKSVRWLATGAGDSSEAVTSEILQSDLRIAGPATTVSPREATALPPLWTMFAISVVMLGSLEWWLFHRRITA